jgi:putative oxidoreductase
MSVGMLLLRIVVGTLFIGHGTRKLFGWFGGGGRQGTAEFVGSLGYYPPATMAIVLGVAETVGGVLLLVGLLTPVGTALIVGVMVSAVLVVHAPKGVWNTNGGAELPVVYIVASLAAALAPGRYSLDHAFGIAWNGRVAAVAALGVGIIVAVGLVVRRDVVRAEAATDTEELPTPPRRSRAA